MLSNMLKMLVNRSGNEEKWQLDGRLLTSRCQCKIFDTLGNSCNIISYLRHQGRHGCLGTNKKRWLYVYKIAGFTCAAKNWRLKVSKTILSLTFCGLFASIACFTAFYRKSMIDKPIKVHDLNLEIGLSRLIWCIIRNIYHCLNCNFSKPTYLIVSILCSISLHSTYYYSSESSEN